MNAFTIIKLVAILLAVVVVIWFFRYYHREELTLGAQIKIALIGFVSNLLDTVGIGSFAVIVALRRMLGVMPDDVRLIGSMNIQAVITALAQTLIFMHFIEVDLLTLIVSISMIALGGFLSSLFVVSTSKRLVHIIMLYAFAITGILLLLTQLNLLLISSSQIAIGGFKLALFALFMLVAGALPAFGVGYYSLVKASIFLFGVNPVIAFPIMASASSYQMPVTSLTFIKKQKFYATSTLLMAIFGVLGVLIAAPIITMVDSYTLKWILLGVVIYNVITLALGNAKTKQQ